MKGIGSLITLNDKAKFDVSSEDLSSGNLRQEALLTSQRRAFVLSYLSCTKLKLAHFARVKKFAAADD